jgi:hypothetical protein
MDLADCNLVAMNATQEKQPVQPPSDTTTAARTPAPKPQEIGGRDGPEPTRYGDWEKNGRCIDF